MKTIPDSWIIHGMGEDQRPFTFCGKLLRDVAYASYIDSITCIECLKVLADDFGNECAENKLKEYDESNT